MNDFINDFSSSKFFYILIYVIQGLCCFMLCFIIGILINNEYLSLESGSRTLQLYVNIVEKTAAKTPEEMQPMLEEILEVLNNKYTEVLYSYTSGEFVNDEYRFTAIFDYFDYEDGKYFKGETYDSIIDAQITVGNNFSNDDYENANHIALIFGDIDEEYEFGKCFSFFSSTYRITGERHSDYDSGGPENERIISIPVTAWDNIPVDTFTVSLRCLMTQNNKAEIEEILKKYYGSSELIIEDYAAENSDLKAAYRTSFIVSSIMLFASFGVLFMLYGFIFFHRRKKIAISRLCGCSRMRCITGYTLECLFTGLISAVSGGVLFGVIQKLWLSEVYPYMNDIFNPAFILIIIAAMTALSTAAGLLQAFLRIRKNLRDML